METKKELTQESEGEDNSEESLKSENNNSNNNNNININRNSSSSCISEVNNHVDPILDTASNCGSEPPTIEGLGQSSFDKFQPDGGDINYVLESLKESLKNRVKESHTKNNVASVSYFEAELSESSFLSHETLQIYNREEFEDYKKQIKKLKEEKECVERHNQELTAQLEQNTQASLAKDEKHKEIVKDLKATITKMKKEHRDEVTGLTISKKNLKETLTKENSQLKKMINSGEVPGSSLSTTINDDDSNLKTSSLDSEKKKSHDASVCFNRSDSILATSDVRFEEGMIKFIEKRNASTDIYHTYIDWFQHMIEEMMDPNTIYQLKRHIFLKREFDDPLTVDDRRLSFSTLGHRKISFGKMKCEAREFCDEDGWPDDIDHMLVLHPEEAKFKELHLRQEDEQGENYSKWFASKIAHDYFYEMDDEFNEKKNILLLCAYKKEEKK